MSRLIAGLLCAVLAAGCQTLHSSDPFVVFGGDAMPQDLEQGLDVAFRQGSFEASPGPGVMSKGDKIVDQSGAVTPQRAAPQTQRTPADRMHVYSGNFQVSTADVQASADQLISIVSSMNGYLQSRTDATVVCRVPSQSFHALIDRLDDCGTVVSRSIQTDDVTDEYRDVGLRLGVMEASRARLVVLMDRAANLDELLKLEERLAKLTAEIESMKGKLKKLNQDASFSTLEVRFATRSVVGQRKSSPFAWVNRLGAEQVMQGFHVAAEPSGKGPWHGMLEGKPPMEAPSGFLVVRENRHELQAVSPDDARVWLREFPVDNKTGPEFWSKAIQTHLVDHLGYRLIDQSEVESISRQPGHQMLFEADSEQGPVRYLLTILRRPKPVWSRQGTIQVVEFAAPANLYADYIDAVGAASPVPIAVYDSVEPVAGVLVSKR